jgi:hypothetical protein
MNVVQRNFAFKDRAVAQLVSRRPVTTEAPVRYPVGPRDIVVDKVALGQGFLFSE